MKKFKKALRVLALICLITLAVIGVGISGGVPLPSFKSRRDPEKEKTELIEQRKQSNSEEAIKE